MVLVQGGAVGRLAAVLALIRFYLIVVVAAFEIPPVVSGVCLDDLRGLVLTLELADLERREVVDSEGDFESLEQCLRAKLLHRSFGKHSQPIHNKPIPRQESIESRLPIE